MARFLVPQRTAVIRRRCTLEALLPEGHLARFVWRTLQSLDFSALERVYATTNGGPGRSPYHPRVLTALWIYGMSQGLETATAIAAACTLRDDFRWLSGGLRPSDQTLLNLLDHAEALVEICKQVLQAMHREALARSVGHSATLPCSPLRIATSYNRLALVTAAKWLSSWPPPKRRKPGSRTAPEPLKAARSTAPSVPQPSAP